MHQCTGHLLLDRHLGGGINANYFLTSHFTATSTHADRFHPSHTLVGHEITLGMGLVCNQ